MIEEFVLFDKNEADYFMYRIPVLCTTATGSILAFTEARKGTGQDYDPIDILMKKSTDGGKTFSHAVRINPYQNGKDVWHNVCIIPQDDIIHLLYCRDYLHCYYSYSMDDGESFSEPTDITYVFEKFGKADVDWKACATGPCVGITHNGRLIVPSWFSLGSEIFKHHNSFAVVIYSDDSGKTWQAGEPIGAEIFKSASETAVAKLSDGSVYLSIRLENDAHRRGFAISTDGVNYDIVGMDKRLVECVCMASLLNDGNKILYSAPCCTVPKDNLWYQRKMMKVYISYDDCKTWKHERIVDEKFSAYSHLAKAGEDYLLLYEAERDGKRCLNLVRFDEKWLIGE